MPKAKNVYFPIIDLVDIPTFALRECVYNTLYIGEFSVKARMTSERDIIDTNKEQFGEIRSDYFWSSCHNIARTIIPETTYLESHPE